MLFRSGPLPLTAKEKDAAITALLEIRKAVTEFGVAKLKPPVWWNSSQVVLFDHVPTMDPPFQHRLPFPVGETGHESTCVQDALRASIARCPLVEGLNRLPWAPATT